MTGRLSAVRPMATIWTAIITIVLLLFAGLVKTDSTASPPPLPQERSLANGIDLRILPLGDSITWGFAASDMNGYREKLRMRLNHGGNQNVTYVGSVDSGNMANNLCECHSGATISEIAAFAQAYMARGERPPNVVLLLAGTNDMWYPRDPETAPDRLDSLVGALVGPWPEAVVVVAKIPPITQKDRPGANELARVYNDAIPGIVNRYQQQERGNKVVMADMYLPFSIDPTSDFMDGMHPMDSGFVKMAEEWYRALVEASYRGFITLPANETLPPTQQPVSSSALVFFIILIVVGLSSAVLAAWFFLFRDRVVVPSGFLKLRASDEPD